MSTLVVLAAGLARRYGGDKQLERVGPGGELLLEYALHDAWRVGCRRAVIVIREELRAAFAEEVVPAWRNRVQVELAVQQVPGPQRRRPWGTVDALLAARAAVAGDVLVCNADDFYGAPAFAALAASLARGEPALAGYPLAATLSPHGPVSRALCRTDAAGRLLRIEERAGISGSPGDIRDETGAPLAADALASMNLWAFRASFFDVLERAFAAFRDAHRDDPLAELRIAEVVNEHVAAGGRLRVLRVAPLWFGMTWAADREAVRAALRERVAAGDYPADLRAG